MRARSKNHVTLHARARADAHTPACVLYIYALAHTHEHARARAQWANVQISVTEYVCRTKRLLTGSYETCDNNVIHNNNNIVYRNVFVLSIDCGRADTRERLLRTSCDDIVVSRFTFINFFSLFFSVYYLI